MLSGGRLATLGGPVSSASAGADSNINGTSVSSIAIPGLLDIRSENATHQFWRPLDQNV